MNKDKLIKYETKNQEYYRKIINKEEKHRIQLSLLISILIICFGVFIIFYPFKNVPIYISYIISIIAFVSSISILIMLIFAYLKDKKMAITKFGVFIDENGIYIPHRNKYWKFKDVEFIFIDEDYHPFLGLVVIKTLKTKPVKVDTELLNKPSKFWSKIPAKDKAFNTFNIELIENMDEFIKVLIYHGVEVYWRRKGSNYIEEVKKKEKDIKEKP